MGCVQEQEWHVVESLKDDIAELKETQFQVKVHEKEIQLITEVRSTLTLKRPWSCCAAAA